MKAYNPYESVLQYAYRLLSYRGRSEKEMRERLKRKGFDENTINSVIDRLRSDGYIDDRRLACFLRRYAEEQKQLSISGTKKFLGGRGVPRSIVDDTVKDIDETENAKKLVEKKLKHMDSYPSGMIIKKLYGILSRKGYPYETIREALRQFNFKEDFK